jgi:hypothetical protein
MEDPFKPIPRFSHPDEFPVVVSSESARELNDISSYDRDLRLAAGYLRHYLGANIEGDRDFGSPLDALWTAAFVLYGRVFATGVRSAPKPNLDVLEADDRDLHNYIIDVRNKYIAHSANGFEQSQTVAFVVEIENGERALTGTAVEHISLSRISRESAERFVALCDLHVGGLAERARVLTNRVTQELIQMGGDHVFGLPRYGKPSIDQSAVRERRKSR